MTIREFQFEDKDQILNLFDEFGDLLTSLDKLKFLIKAPNYAETFLREMLERTTIYKGIIYVAEDDGKIVGFIAGNIKELTPENTVENLPMIKGRILELFITQNYRGNGAGKALMNKMESFFKAQNCTAINVEVFAPNSKACSFYEHFGFEARNIDMIKVIK